MKLPVTVEVSKEAYELGQGAAKFIVAAKQALANGWQPGDDLPAIMAALMADLVPALQGVDKLGAEAQEDSGAFAMAWMLAAKEVYGSLVKKDVVPAVGG